MVRKLAGAVFYGAVLAALAWWGHALVNDPCAGDAEHLPASCSAS